MNVNCDARFDICVTQTQVIIYGGYMMLAGVFATWYFTEWNDKKSGKVRGSGTAQLSHHPIYENVWRVLRYHLGTVAFGAMLITIVRIIRMVFNYLTKHTKGKSNMCLKCIFACVNCCLKCLECIMNMINQVCCECLLV